MIKLNEERKNRRGGVREGSINKLKLGNCESMKDYSAWTLWWRALNRKLQLKDI